MRLLLSILAILSLAGCGSSQVSHRAPQEVDNDPALRQSAHSVAAAPALLDGRKVHYVERGSGEDALLLIHGWASDHAIWEPQLAAFAATHRVVAIDLPGHGDSEPPKQAYSVDLFADAIAAVMDHARIDDAVLIGHSNGVPAVRQFYRRYPERTRALVAVDGPLRSMFNPAIAERFVRRFESETYRDNVAAYLEGLPRYKLSDEWFAAIHEMAGRQSQEALVGGLKAATAADIWEPDPIDCPLLMINASQPAWTKEYVTWVHELVPHVEYNVWPGVSHFLHVERPEQFNETVASFLASQRLASQKP